MGVDSVTRVQPECGYSDPDAVHKRIVDFRTHRLLCFIILYQDTYGTFIYKEHFKATGIIFFIRIHEQFIVGVLIDYLLFLL